MCWHKSQRGALWLVRKADLEEDFALNILEKQEEIVPSSSP